jgi:tRNA 2-selenouridine synthase
MFQDITIEQFIELKQKQNIAFIDVRSPSEFRDFTIPGSQNIPLFDDEERKEVGTLYKQVSAKAAQDRGLEIVSAKLPAYIKSFEKIASPKVVYCWRGGMRSKTTATVLSLMGIRVYRLTGGIRAYRNWVYHTLDNTMHLPTCVVISGHTGTGKTKVLRKLLDKGYPVIDLEQMAQHRGSIFGHISLQPNNQKMFEALLVEQLIQYRNQPYVLIEAESSRIGKVVMPEFLVTAKEQGLQILLEMPQAQRIQYIIEDYQPSAHQEDIIQAFEHISKRLHTPIATQINERLHDGDYHSAIKLLLEHYYDPRYTHGGVKYDRQPIICQAQDADDAVYLIENRLKQLFPL